MNYKKVLEKLGLIENVDFALTAESFEMLPKTRIVEITPAVLDEEGNVITPAVTEEQTYTPDAPSLEQLAEANNEVLVDECDIVDLISLYLKGKDDLRDLENDSMNIVENRIYFWGFKNIPAPSIAELASLVIDYKAKKEKENRIKQKIALGEMTDNACTSVFKLIQGYNVDRKLTKEQKDQMIVLFAPALQAISVRRPLELKKYIQSITPDGILVTDDIKEDILTILGGI